MRFDLLTLTAMLAVETDSLYFWCLVATREVSKLYSSFLLLTMLPFLFSLLPQHNERVKNELL
jgi:hypothetical protein